MASSPDSAGQRKHDVVLHGTRPSGMIPRIVNHEELCGRQRVHAESENTHVTRMSRVRHHGRGPGIPIHPRDPLTIPRLLAKRLRPAAHAKESRMPHCPSIPLSTAVGSRPRNTWHGTLAWGTGSGGCTNPAQSLRRGPPMDTRGMEQHHGPVRRSTRCVVELPSLQQRSHPE